MGLEAATFLNDLVATNPDGAVDPKSEGDNHLRLLKAVLKATFPGMAGAFARVQAKSAGYTVVAGDNSSLFNCTTALTLAWTAAATLGNKHMVAVFANGGDVVLDPNGAELVNGLATLTIPNGASALVFCDGVGLKALTFSINAFVDSVFRLLGSVDATKKLAFEVDGFTTATTRTLTPQDKDGVIALTTEFAYANLAGSPGRMIFPPMHIQGMIASNNGADAVNDIDVSAGSCADATGAHNIILTAITKQLDAAWAVGTNAGGLDTGSIGNNDYFIWAIKRSDTGVCDVLFSLSVTAPTMPANYDFKRLLGWFRRSAGAIVAFFSLETAGGGIKTAWKATRLDVDVVEDTTANLRVISVPVGIRVKANLNVYASCVGSMGIYVSSPDVNDEAVSITAAPLANVQVSTDSPADEGIMQVEVMTDASAQIRTRALAASTTLRIATLDWEWSRR